MSEEKNLSEIIVEMSQKVDKITQVVSNIEYNNKLLANKITRLLSIMDSKDIKPEQPKYNIQPVNDRNVKIEKETNVVLSDPQDEFRRTSRPESINKPKLEFVPIIDKPKDIITKKPNIIDKADDVKDFQLNSIPVTQRVIDIQSKSVFLADVEILDKDGNFVQSTRTNPTGKWSVTLAPGMYKVNIMKNATLSRSKLVSNQDIIIDGKQNRVDLGVITLK